MMNQGTNCIINISAGLPAGADFSVEGEWTCPVVWLWSKRGEAPMEQNTAEEKNQTKRKTTDSLQNQSFSWWRLLDSNQWPHACEEPNRIGFTQFPRVSKGGAEE